MSMKTTILFAIDSQTQETIVSESEKGSNRITPIERIPRAKNEWLYAAVTMLTDISRSPDFDPAIFKAVDKVCQLIYAKHAAKA
jgi:hypothetical protein